MNYPITRDSGYDFADQSYASAYPNLHKYPATMLPQIGIKLLNEFNCTGDKKLLDPYCGSGSTFASAMECGISNAWGFDLNPLAILISRARFSNYDEAELRRASQVIKDGIESKNYPFSKNRKPPTITNKDIWFSKGVFRDLSIIKCFIDQTGGDINAFLSVAFSETVRLCSYARNGEFKLVRIPEDKRKDFKPDVFGTFFKKLDNNINTYLQYYQPKVKQLHNFILHTEAYRAKGLEEYFDVVLTSPPYGDSKTTVAYGQFSTLSNEWLGISSARQLDKSLMGGIRDKDTVDSEIMTAPINAIKEVDARRALDVVSFYNDLASSISEVSMGVAKGGKVFYVVGNRTVKNTLLPTDQFVAEQFEKNGLKHIKTIERLLSNKAMPLRNSPTNERGKTANTMLMEYIIICEK